MLSRDLAMGIDPVLFAVEGLGFRPDRSQAQVLRWTKQRLLLNCTRQWGKEHDCRDPRPSPGRCFTPIA